MVVTAPVGHDAEGLHGYTSTVLQQYEPDSIVVVWGTTATIERVEEVCTWSEVQNGVPKLNALRSLVESATMDIGYIGTRVSRRDRKWYKGKVTFHGVVCGRRNKRKLLQVKYLDGDLEELNSRELSIHCK